ncbi:permease [Sulfurifustis variabilis]|uniref:Permease n=1 Tax=Sulfurifustis variabilis TaxID=1675686 RepID=A0A1B4V697_9GAMM|nr:AI-2E family transporter [Sulfurifustis variabilis]BAU49093.1 permease [Sulfurifustis variabilis]
MEPDATRPPTPGEAFYARTFALITLLLLGFLLYQILLPFFGPLAWALFIAFLLRPVHAWLTGKLRGRASLSAALLTFAVLLLLIGPLAGLSAAFAAQVAVLLQYAQELAAGRTAEDFANLASVPVLGTALAWFQDTFGVSLAQIQGWAVEAARTVLQFLATLGGRIFIGALGTAIGFVLMMFLLFFMIRDGQQMVATLRELVPMTAGHRARLFDHLAAVIRAVFYGTGVTALIQGALIGIGFAILGLPAPIVFGVLAALFALVPLAGTPFVWVPAVIVLIAQQRWWAAIFLLVWGILVATMDNVLRPVLVSSRAKVGTLTVFIGVLGGVSAFGAIGLFVGPLVLALVIALIRFTLELRHAEAAEAGAAALPAEEARAGRR